METLIVRQNTNVKVRVPVIRDTGYSERIYYQVEGLPSGVTATFNPSFSEGDASTSTELTLSVALGAPLGGFRCAVSGSPRPPRNKGNLSAYVEGSSYGGGSTAGSGMQVKIIEALILSYWEISLRPEDGYTFTGHAPGSPGNPVNPGTPGSSTFANDPNAIDITQNTEITFMHLLYPTIDTPLYNNLHGSYNSRESNGTIRFHNFTNFGTSNIGKVCLDLRKAFKNFEGVTITPDGLSLVYEQFNPTSGNISDVVKKVDSTYTGDTPLNEVRDMSSYSSTSKFPISLTKTFPELPSITKGFVLYTQDIVHYIQDRPGEIQMKNNITSRVKVYQYGEYIGSIMIPEVIADGQPLSSKVLKTYWSAPYLFEEVNIFHSSIPVDPQGRISYTRSPIPKFRIKVSEYSGTPYISEFKDLFDSVGNEISFLPSGRVVEIVPGIPASHAPYFAKMIYGAKEDSVIPQCNVILGVDGANVNSFKLTNVKPDGVTWHTGSVNITEFVQ